MFYNLNCQYLLGRPRPLRSSPRRCKFWARCNKWRLSRAHDSCSSSIRDKSWKNVAKTKWIKILKVFMVCRSIWSDCITLLVWRNVYLGWLDVSLILFTSKSQSYKLLPKWMKNGVKQFYFVLPFKNLLLVLILCEQCLWKWCLKCFFYNWDTVNIFQECFQN